MRFNQQFTYQKQYHQMVHVVVTKNGAKHPLHIVVKYIVVVM